MKATDSKEDLFGVRDNTNHHNRQVMGSSNDMTWTTPQPVFDALNAEFNFTLDPCALSQTAKCKKFFTPFDDGLKKDWSQDTVFMNPPYGKWLRVWMRKAFEESRKGALVVCLVPARVDTQWWHDYAIHGQVRFWKGRLKNKNGQAWPFPVAIVIFRPNETRRTSALQGAK